MLPPANTDSFILQSYIQDEILTLNVSAYQSIFSHTNHVGINTKVYNHSLLSSVSIKIAINNYILLFVFFRFSNASSIFFIALTIYHLLLKMYIIQNKSLKITTIYYKQIYPTIGAFWKCVMNSLSKYESICLFNKYLLKLCVYVCVKDMLSMEESEMN